MAGSERFFGAIKTVMLLFEDVKRLSEKTERLASRITEMDRRLVRVETVIEIGLAGRDRLELGHE